MDIRVELYAKKLVELGLDQDIAVIISLDHYGYKDEADKMIEIKKYQNSLLYDEMNKIFVDSIPDNDIKEDSETK
jgi:hypothetical protein